MPGVCHWVCHAYGVTDSRHTPCRRLGGRCGVCLPATSHAGAPRMPLGVIGYTGPECPYWHWVWQGYHDPRPDPGGIPYALAMPPLNRPRIRPNRTRRVRSDSRRTRPFRQKEARRTVRRAGSIRRWLSRRRPHRTRPPGGSAPRSRRRCPRAACRPAPCRSPGSPLRPTGGPPPGGTPCGSCPSPRSG